MGGWEGGGGFFFPLLKKSSGNPYQKILDFSQLFNADAPIKKDNKNSFTPVQSTFGTPGTKIQAK